MLGTQVCSRLEWLRTPPKTSPLAPTPCDSIKRISCQIRCVRGPSTRGVLWPPLPQRCCTRRAQAQRCGRPRAAQAQGSA